MRTILKKGLLFFIDTSIIIFSLWLVFSLRLERFYNLTEIYYKIYLIYLIVFYIFFYIFKIYNIIITYFDFHSIKKIIKAILFSQLILIFINLLMYVDFLFPRSISFIAPMFVGLFIVLSRIAINFVINVSQIPQTKKNILIYGINNETVLFAQNLRNYNKSFNIIGFFDLNNKYTKRDINGIIVYNKFDLETIINKNKIYCLFTQENFIVQNKNEHEKILKICSKYNVRIKQIFNLKKDIKFNLKNITLDFFDVIQKKKFNNSDKTLVKEFRGKNILITGAAGSIGSELTFKLLKYNPNKIFLLDNSEVGLFSLLNKINVSSKKKTIVLLGDCSDNNFVKSLSIYNIDYLFHVAAYKHVDFLEKNIFSAVKNNIFATINILNFVLNNKIKKFTYISTDKAVKPISILGITKKFGELLSAYYYSLNKNKSIFTVVRFGNVIGSSGSALPIFYNQIINRQAITVRNKKSKRYFMSILEAVDLVLYSSIMNKNFNVYALDMGSQINIYNIAERMIRLLGFNIKDKNYPDGDISISISNLKKGEKLREEITLGAKLSKTNHPKIFCCEENFNLKKIKKKINLIRKLYIQNKINKNILSTIVNS
jgi:FlaA1/EpsC-like NDP-sugar epimerase